MSRRWSAREARARFNELLAACETHGPQIIMKRGVETAVLLPIAQWRKLEKMTKPDLKDLLLAPEVRTEKLTPPRIKRPRRLLAVPEYGMRSE